jgi:hypothetical protein
MFSLEIEIAKLQNALASGLLWLTTSWRVALRRFEPAVRLSCLPLAQRQ